MQRLPTFIWFTRAMIVVVGSCGCLLGAMFILGGQGRFVAPSLLYARGIPGGSTTWGVLFLIGGCGALGGVIHGWHPRTLAISLWGLSSAYLFFATSIWLSVLTSKNAPLTGGVTYLELACISLLCGVVARRLS